MIQHHLLTDARDAHDGDVRGAHTNGPNRAPVPGFDVHAVADMSTLSPDIRRGSAPEHRFDQPPRVAGVRCRARPRRPISAHTSPGPTIDEYPNWRLPLPVTLEQLRDDPWVARIVSVVGDR